MIDKIIDCIDENGNNFLDNIIMPIAKGTFQYTVNDTKVVQYFLTMKTAFMENKISQFLKYIEDKNDNSILDFIKSLNQKEKVFFIETVNKIIDMDDSLQIYILSQLTKSFKKNGELNYWEKSLYYNINQITEDDFLNLFVILESLEKPIQAKQNYGLLNTINTDERNLSIKKFVNIGMINNSRAQFQEKIINSEEDISSVTLYLYPFAIELYEMIEKYQEIGN